MSKIKAVLFDLDGTLFHHLPSSGEVFLNYLKTLGRCFSEEDRIRSEHWVHYYFAHSPEVQADTRLFKGDEHGFRNRFIWRRMVALGMNETEAIDLAPRVSDYMLEAYKPEAHVPEDARSFLEFLYKSGYILGMVSNRSSSYQEEMRDKEIASYFRFFLAAGEVNSFKPDALIFERALELAGTLAHETMYIGDNYFADVIGSQRAGLVPVLYDPSSLFPEAECVAVRSFAEIPPILK